MLGNTITINVGSFATPEELVLTKVNQDGYSSEYRGLSGYGKVTAFVRHSTEKTPVNGLKMDRHQFEIRIDEAPTEVYPQGRVFDTYLIIRHPSSADESEVNRTAFAVPAYSLIATFVPQLVNWES